MSAVDAQYEAQKIAFAPIIFQVARCLREFNILALLQEQKSGLCLEELQAKTNLSPYALKVLLESGMSANMLEEREGRYFSTKVGYFIQNDKMTRVNMDYNHYVNYKALYLLEESLVSGKPEGLKEFGEWESIYPALTSLPQKASESWFSFDHFYSDSAFGGAIDILRKEGVKSIVDVGGNTGKFAIKAAKEADINVTIVDIKEQLIVADKNIRQEGLSHKINLVEGNVLDEGFSFPSGSEAIWMSQFLDCFAEDEVVRIVTKASKALAKGGVLYVMEPMWDRQKFETSAFCIINTSPYFTATANGRSKMYSFEDMKSMVERAGLCVDGEYDNLGICQTLLRCRVRDV